MRYTQQRKRAARGYCEQGVARNGASKRSVASTNRRHIIAEQSGRGALCQVTVRVQIDRRVGAHETSDADIIGSQCQRANRGNRSTKLCIAGDCCIQRRARLNDTTVVERATDRQTQRASRKQRAAVGRLTTCGNIEQTGCGNQPDIVQTGIVQQQVAAASKTTIAVDVDRPDPSRYSAEASQHAIERQDVSVDAGDAIGADNACKTDRSGSDEAEPSYRCDIACIIDTASTGTKADRGA